MPRKIMKGKQKTGSVIKVAQKQRNDPGSKDTVTSPSNEVNKAMEMEATEKTPVKRGRVTRKVSEGITKATAKAVATFAENDQDYEMEVEAPETNEFNSESLDDEQSEVITFKGQNNNTTIAAEKETKGRSKERKDTELNEEAIRSPDTSDSEGKIVSEDDDTDTSNDTSSMDTSEGESEAEVENCARSNNKAKKMLNKSKPGTSSEANREEIIDAAVARFQDVFMKSGLTETADLLRKQMEQKNQTTNKEDDQRKRGESMKRKLKSNNKSMSELNKLMSQASTSELTVYKNAVENQINMHLSSSSEELKPIDTSDEVIDSDETADFTKLNKSLVEDFIADTRE